MKTVSQRELDTAVSHVMQVIELGRTADKEAVALALSASEKAVGKAEEEARQWRSSANEWRGAMSDREASFVPRAEYDNAVKSANEKTGLLTERVSSIEGRFMAIAAIGTAFGIASVIYAVVK